jgi:hypothetical protein
MDGRAKLLIRERVAYPDGGLVEMVVWLVPKPVPPSVHRFKYRLVYIERGARVLGYDNERGKGDHRHAGKTEESIEFGSLEALINRFVAEVEDLRRSR